MSSPSSKNRFLPFHERRIGKYQLIEELGRGGMATVYRAHDPRLGRDVAIKLLHPHLRDSLEIAHRFSAEAKAVAKLKHPNIVEVYDVSSENDEEQFLVVELIHGGTLRKLLSEQKSLPPEVSAALGIELLEALSHAHISGVIHRDIKPENVMVTCTSSVFKTDSSPNSIPPSNQHSACIKLMDFGIAKLLDAQGVTSTGQVLGSPSHMAPEQIEGASVDERADIFSMGVLLYECMVGELPFFGTNPAQVLRKVLACEYKSAELLKPEIGKNYSSILDHALAREPDHRFSSAAHFRDALMTELLRLGFSSPKELLENYLKNELEFRTIYKKKLIENLEAKAEAAAQLGDVLAASNDYNRALALEPDNHTLVKKIARMSKLKLAHERKKKLKKAIFLSLALFPIVFLCSAIYSFFKQSKSQKTNKVVEGPQASASILSVASLPTEMPSLVPASSSSLKLQLDLPITVTLPKESKRTIHFGKVYPNAGVLYSMNGSAPTALSSGDTLTLSSRSHEILLSCVSDMCTPARLFIEASDKNNEQNVRMFIKPAALLLEGNPLKNYGILQHPEIQIRTNLTISIPMSSGSEPITLLERETGIKRSGVLKPGKTLRVNFLTPE